MERRSKKVDPVMEKIELKIKDEVNLKPVKINNRLKKDNKIKIFYPEEDTKKIAKIIYPDGDSKKVSQRPELYKRRSPTEVKPQIAPKEEIKPKPPLRPPNEIAKELLNKRIMDLKRIREKYTSRLKNQNVNGRPMEMKKDDKFALPNVDEKIVQAAEQTKKTEEILSPKDKSVNSTKDSETKDKKEPSTKKKSTVIKTITTKNGSVKMYKAVSFVEKKKLTPLQVKIPTVMKKSSRIIDTHSLKSKVTSSKNSIKDSDVVRKKAQKKRERKQRHVPSARDSFTDSCCRSPPTEVARWVPASIDRQTKPYYEAWVDTTLAAKSKYSSKDKIKYHKKAFLKTLGNALDRPSSPELVYSRYNDQSYTGKIKITQKY